VETIKNNDNFEEVCRYVIVIVAWELGKLMYQLFF